MSDTITPNAKLAVVEPTRRNWAAAMNRNMELLDAIIGAYFVVGSLQGVWENSTVYGVGDCIVDPDTSAVWQCQVAHTSASIPTTFAQERAAHSTYWTVFSSPARARGAWTAFTNYAINDFVVSGSQYAVCIETHTSGAAFATDLAAGKWSVLVDLSSAGSLVLPVLAGAADANKTVTTNAAGTAYIIRTITDTLTMLGATTVGNAMFTAVSEAAGRAAINAQIAGSYQPLDADLTSIAANGISVFGLAALLYADAAAARAAITPLTANYDLWTRVGGIDARLARGVANRLLRSDGTVFSWEQVALATDVSGTLDRANGGFTPATLYSALGADVALAATGTYYTGPSIAQGTSGTWLVWAKVTVTSGGIANINARLTDGTTVIDSGRETVAGTNQAHMITLIGVITNPAGNLRVTVNDSTRTDGTIKFNFSGNSLDSSIIAIRIG